MSVNLTNPDDFGDSPSTVSHRVIGERIRPPASQAVYDKAITAGIEAGLTSETATLLAYASPDVQQLRRALREKKTQRFGTEVFTYIETDILMWHVMSSPDNIRFEGEHAHGDINMPRFGSVNGQALLTFEMNSTALIEAMGPQIADMAEHNPHIQSIKDRGIETPGWLSFLRLTTELGDVTRFETTDGYGRSVGSHRGLRLMFKDIAFNLLPKSRQATALHHQIAKWAISDDVSDVEAEKVRCAIMPNARIIIACNSEPFHLARRHFVAHLHMAPPMPFSLATNLNAKANAAVDKLHAKDLLPSVAGLSPEQVRDILDGTWRAHDLLPDETAVLACSALNPHQNTRQARAVNEAITDLTGVAPRLEDRSMIAAEVALRGLPNDPRLTRRRSALERAWRLADLRTVTLTRTDPLQLLATALVDLVQRTDKRSAARAELATLASYHMVAGQNQLLERSEHGATEGATEPTKIIAALGRTDLGLRQLCQIVLDGRAGRAPQRLPERTDPVDKPIGGADSLTPQILRDLADQPTPGVAVLTPEEQYAMALTGFESALDRLHTAAVAVAEVKGTDGEPLAETRGYDQTQAMELFGDVTEMIADWRAAARKAARRRQRMTEDGDR
ncbi:hypothetical protein [Micromonospora sp. NPDC002717]|uniref:hypothetical protein n=1 Tax=Micromonospora sp. NPDC002717 TaxID=3154424 RepID=UPI00332DE673